MKIIIKRESSALHLVPWRTDGIVSLYTLDEPFDPFVHSVPVKREKILSSLCRNIPVQFTH